MPYPCPERADFEEVHALNSAFLKALAHGSAAASHMRGLAPALIGRLRELSDSELERLAAVPILLLGFEEHDQQLWEQPEAREPHPQLFDIADTECARLSAPGLGFAWQLARRNPYVLRLLTGASLHWCERLAEQSLLSALQRAHARADLPSLRAADDTDVWRKLLYDGVSRRDNVRRAAQLCILQMRLTRPPSQTPRRWASAACRTRVPALTLTSERGSS